MNLSRKDIEWLDLYESNELSPEDKTLIQQRLKSDPEFAKAARTFLLTRKGIVYSGSVDLLNQMAAWETAYEESGSGRQDSTPKIKKTDTRILKGHVGVWNAIAIAASVVLLSTLIWVFVNQKSSEDILAAKFEHLHVNVDQQRSTSSSKEDEARTNAFTFYEFKDYERAATLLEGLYDTQGDTTSLLYAGISYFGAGEYQKAFLILTSPPLSNNEDAKKYAAILSPFMESK